MGILISTIRITFFPPTHDTSPLPGKTYVVTGGLSGLGLHTTLHLALRGALVLVGARSPSRALVALDALEAQHPQIKGHVKIFELDLSLIELAREGAQRVLAMTERLNGLCNNAGRLGDAAPYEISKDGIEMFAQVNYFGTVVFTQMLLPLLTQTAKEPGSDVRIVVVSSNAGTALNNSWAFTGPETFNDPLAKPSSAGSMIASFKRYGASKVLTILWVAELQRRLDDSGAGITVIAVHPGGVATDKVLASAFPISTIARLLFATPSSGAITSLFALTSREVVKHPGTYKGKYVEPYGRVAVPPPGRAAEDPVAARKLWEVTEAVLARGGMAME